MPNIPTNKKLYSSVKSQAKKKFKVWPSAYASGWLVQKYKKLGGKYRTSTFPKKRVKSRKRRSVKSRKRRRVKSRKRRSVKSRRRRSVKSRRRRSVKSRRRRSVKSRRRRSVKSRKRRSVKSRRRRSVKSRKRRSVKSRKRRSKRSVKSKSAGLSRWFAEEWIDVCKLPRIVPCGRKNSRKSKRSYPYCRPRYKITSKSPRSARSFSAYEIKKRCKQKRKSPSKRVEP
jgi:hypothetical protein